jgi:hypothetical protein
METKRAARYLVLKDNHPTMVKLNKLYALAEELGIRINFSSRGCGPATVDDNERDLNLPSLIIEDLDNGEYIHEWPPTFEFKVYYDNPKYLEEKRQEEEEWHRTRMEREKAEREERKKKAAAEAAEKQRSIELAERAELARLKSKYQEE